MGEEREFVLNNRNTCLSKPVVDAYFKLQPEEKQQCLKIPLEYRSHSYQFTVHERQQFFMHNSLTDFVNTFDRSDFLKQNPTFTQLLANFNTDLDPITTNENILEMHSKVANKFNAVLAKYCLENTDFTLC